MTIKDAKYIAKDNAENQTFEVFLSYTYVSPIDTPTTRRMLVMVAEGFITRDDAWAEAERLGKNPLTEGVPFEYT